jgi:hypothetical protein
MILLATFTPINYRAWMESHELSTLRADVEHLRHMLLELAARQEDTESLQAVSEMEIPENLFDAVSAGLVRLRRDAAMFDAALAESLKECLTENHLENGIAQLGLSLSITSRRRKVHQSALRAFFRRVTGFKSNAFDKETQTSIPQVLRGLSRLLPLIAAFETLEFNRHTADDPILRPSHITNNFVVDHIEAAIREVREAPNIIEAQRSTLIVYLEEAKAEVKRERPSWKKIIGALVIVASILQGIAAAPAAVENLQAAVRHITGSSVEQPSPYILRDSKHKDSSSNRNDRRPNPEEIPSQHGSIEI